MNLVERVYAQYTIPGLTPRQGGGTIQGLFSEIITITLLIAGALAVIYLIYSGILYITAAGNPDSAKKGQQGIINAVIGIAVILLAFVIFNAVANQIAPAQQIINI